MRTSPLLRPRGAPEVSWTVPRNASPRFRRGTFSTRRTCSVKSTGRVVESILFETCSPIKPVLATPFRDEWRGDFVFSCPSCFRCARHASGRRRVRSRFPRKPKETNGGRYRIRTYDFHRVKVARCFVIRELRRTLGSAQECSGAYFSKTYEHGPESWTHKWTHVKPGWHPVLFRLALHFGGGSLVNCCGLVSSAHWQLDPLQLPQVSTMKE